MKIYERTKLVSEMVEASQEIRDLIAGGKNMRKCGERYLPMFPMESQNDYKARLASTWLFNGTKKAREDMAGKVFEKPARLADQEGRLFDWCQNIDLEGRDLSNFAYDVFRASIDDGISFIMVDAPPREGDVTVGQARSMNLRPYMSLVKLNDVLGWKWENIGNAPTLTQFRIMESVEKPDRSALSDETIDQVRALFLENRRVVIRLYQKTDDKKGEWVQVNEDQITEMTEIQIVPVYTGRTAFMKAEPPLADIAEINLAHWRVQSDKSNCLHKALSPLLLIKGIDVGEDGNVVNSAGYAFHGGAEHADLKWAEITGSGIKAGSDELSDLEKQMQWMGLQLIMERSGVSTATGDTLDENKSTSKLKNWADNLKDALEIALSWMVDMGGISANTGVVVHTDFNTFGHLPLSDVRDMYSSGVISRETYMTEAQRRGVISEDISPEDEAERIESEGLSGEIVE